ncbi:ECF-type sigma factor [Ideonella sp. BN130291]|uniref:ECF-type sigma factor n=1 Tax=Ideonella sp. BN130291 TaxID=3112940 RepID=UPI002E25836C|nr:ECF-type sigma factor [Ideonella sp. BN130291]
MSASPSGLDAPACSPPATAPAASRSAVTALLHSWSEGDDRALDRLVPLVYDDLRRLARRHLRQERDGHTLEGTGLVHEAFMRLAERRSVQWTSRAQFFGWMSTLMRRILVDHARSRNAAKRGAGAPVQSLDALQDEYGELPGQASDELQHILQVDEALQRLTQLDERQGRVVELRFFGGLSVEETAEALQVSPATVKREWATARAWLLRELHQQEPAARS